jgi:dihydroorotase
VATDHAPHPAEDKDCEWAEAAMGMVGLETAVGVVAEAMISTGLMDWAGVAERMSMQPAVIGRLAGQGRALAVGEPANITLINTSVPYLVEPRALRSASRNTPYAGRSLPVSVWTTFYKGELTLDEGVLVNQARNAASAG